MISKDAVLFRSIHPGVYCVLLLVSGHERHSGRTGKDQKK